MEWICFLVLQQTDTITKAVQKPVGKAARSFLSTLRFMIFFHFEGIFNTSPNLVSRMSDSLIMCIIAHAFPKNGDIPCLEAEPYCFLQAKLFDRILVTTKACTFFEMTLTWSLNDSYKQRHSWFLYFATPTVPRVYRSGVISQESAVEDWRRIPRSF